MRIASAAPAALNRRKFSREMRSLQKNVSRLPPARDGRSRTCVRARALEFQYTPPEFVSRAEPRSSHLPAVRTRFRLRPYKRDPKTRRIFPRVERPRSRILCAANYESKVDSLGSWGPSTDRRPSVMRVLARATRGTNPEFIWRFIIPAEGYSLQPTSISTVPFGPTFPVVVSRKGEITLLRFMNGAISRWGGCRYRGCRVTPEVLPVRSFVTITRDLSRLESTVALRAHD